MNAPSQAPDEAGANSNYISSPPDEAGVVELLPCPFCGKLPRECPDNSYGEARVYCPDDNDCAIAPMASADLNDCEDISDARRHWNTRALSPPPVVEEAGLRNAAKRAITVMGTVAQNVGDEAASFLSEAIVDLDNHLRAPTPPAGEAVERLEASDALPVRRAIVAAEQAALEAYLTDYVMSTEGPDYEPNEWERSLIEDALQGYLVERDKAVREALAALPTTGLTISDELRETREALCRMLAAYRELAAKYGPTNMADFDQHEAYLFASQAISNREDTWTPPMSDNLKKALEEISALGSRQISDAGVAMEAIRIARHALASTPASSPTVTEEMVECHGLDTPGRVCFYEQDFYVLSNFSSFTVEWSGFLFPTSEHLYHWLRFTLSEDSFGPGIAEKICRARSAHDAFKIAQDNKQFQISNWNERKVGVMKRVLHAKADQHEYVRRKLLATGDRELVENSWRDDFWGWGPDRNGKNMLGKLWMEVRNELRSVLTAALAPEEGR